MKRINNVLFFLVGTFFPLSADKCVSSLCEDAVLMYSSEKGHLNKTPFCKPVAFTVAHCTEGVVQVRQKDVGRKGYMITQPGVYRLIEDIKFRPQNGNSSAITIIADNVLLDLNGYSLAQVNTKESNCGIVVRPNRTSITIANGTIKNFGALGIRVLKGCSHIMFDSLDILDCGGRGVPPYDLEELPFVSGGISLEGNAGIDGIASSRVSHVTIQNCLMSIDTISPRRTQTENFTILSGFASRAVDNITIFNCTTDIMSGISKEQADPVSGNCAVRGISCEDSHAMHICFHDTTIGTIGEVPVAAAFFDSVINSSYRNSSMFLPDGSTGSDYLSSSTSSTDPYDFEEGSDAGLKNRLELGYVGVYTNNCSNFILQNTAVSRTNIARQLPTTSSLVDLNVIGEVQS